jgi:hypothetical protein
MVLEVNCRNFVGRLHVDHFISGTLHCNCNCIVTNSIQYSYIILCAIPGDRNVTFFVWLQLVRIWHACLITIY